MTIHVIGAAGMLGKRVVAELQHDLHRAWTRADCDFAEPAQVLRLFEAHVKPGDRIINCAGRIPARAVDAMDMIDQNATLPHVVAWAAASAGAHVYHISTDCVFGPRQGQKHPHDVHTSPAPIDIYGRSKLLGEVTGKHVLNIRTSFVGPDHGLWRWLAEQPEGATITGWPNHLWSGSTVWEVASHVRNIATGEHLPHGVTHLSTVIPTSKLGVILQLLRHLGRDDVKVLRDPRPVCNRGLQPTGSPLRILRYALEDRSDD